MIKTFFNRLIVGASTFCAVPILFPTGAAFAQPQPKAVLFPLESRSFELEQDAIALDAVSDRINTHFSDNDPSAEESSGLDLNELPIIGSFVDESGNFDMDLPVSVSIDDLVGETVLVIGTDFSPQSIEHKPRASRRLIDR